MKALFYTQYIKHSQRFDYAKVELGDNMISYKPLYETMYKQGITEYALIYKEGISANTMYRNKQGKAITTKTIDTLCFILHCRVEDIIQYVENLKKDVR